MRGGAIPLLAWATILLVLYAGNWIWEGRPIQMGTTVFAIVVIYGGAGILWLFRREALQRGPPPPAPEIESVPEASIGSVLVALASASILFGLVWALFFVYFGAGLLILALGRVAIELRAERRTRERISEAER
ncbi:MAG: hypothetical protein M3076_01810 [Actinomycetota bacterium]|nr:hypothetical protein [Actinomycetota bacterium]